MKSTRAFAFAAAAGLCLDVSSAEAVVLSAVEQRGYIKCGVEGGLVGFSALDDHGSWRGLNVDYCKAIAAAVLGDASKVRFMPTNPKERFIVLQTGAIDVLIANATWTMSRESLLGISFAAINYYDGQGFMVRKSLSVKSAKALNGATVCVQTGTTTELNLADYFQTNNMIYRPVVFEKLAEAVHAYASGRCDAYTSDASALHSIRAHLHNPGDHVALPEIISKEPLGPAVRQGDWEWFMIVRWVHHALINAEELGVTQANVDQMLFSTSPEVKRFLGREGDLSKYHLRADWVARVIKAVGNYGEVFDRNIGIGSPLKVERGLNRLWNKGGLHYAPPFR